MIWKSKKDNILGKHIEIWDEIKDRCIYLGHSIYDAYDRLYEYIVDSEHLDESILGKYGSYVHEISDEVLEKEFGLKFYKAKI